MRARSPIRSCSFSGIPLPRFCGNTPRMKVGAKIAPLSSSPPSGLRTFRSRAVSVMTLSESLRTTPRSTRSFGSSAFRYTRGFCSQTSAPLPSCWPPPWLTAATARTAAITSPSARMMRRIALPRLPRDGEPVTAGRVLQHLVLWIPGRAGGERGELRRVDRGVHRRAGAAGQSYRVARDGVAGGGAVVLPAVLVTLLVPPEIDPVWSPDAPGRQAHDVGEHAVAVGGVRLRLVGRARVPRLAGRVGPAERRRDPELHDPRAPVVPDAVVPDDVAVPAADQETGAHGDIEGRADHLRVALPDRAVLLEAVLVALLAEQVEVVRVDLVALPLRAVLRHARVARGERVCRDSRRVAVELRVVRVDAVPGGARPADGVPVGVHAVDLDAVALAVALGARPGIDAGVARAVGGQLAVEAVVRGEREEAVLAAPARDDVLHAEAVRLEHVDVVEVRELDGEVAEVYAIRRVRANHVQLLARAVDQDLARLRARALDLDVALVVATAIRVRPVADDRDQVLSVRALGLVLVVRDTDRSRGAVAGRLVLLIVAGAGLSRLGHAPARLLAVDTGEHEDARAVLRGVDRRLNVVELAAPQQRQIASLGLAGELLTDPRAGVALADDERRTRALVLGH